ncbi:hypothetical protein [Jiangella anatolica]|uniref:Uncharacterized protein n=1 Tax=Jiangella anatolica TaxID=2670374 RepID=A0A2W2BL43_9ACTN|nr:hypothetical protein [Jiangella anatolica]PZF86040.1 hypothetical protein C1I92_02295 [Jiangella anatolica]
MTAWNMNLIYDGDHVEEGFLDALCEQLAPYQAVVGTHAGGLLVSLSFDDDAAPQRRHRVGQRLTAIDAMADADHLVRMHARRQETVLGRLVDARAVTQDRAETELAEATGRQPRS